MITRLTFDQISTAVHDAYEACKDIKGGQNAHYIPYLANINPIPQFANDRRQNAAAP